MTLDKTYKDWPLIEELPESWSISKHVGSPLHGHVFVTNGKSVFSADRQVALLKVKKRSLPELKVTIETQPTARKPTGYTFDKASAPTLNDLARQQTKQKLLQDILFDLTVCEIEGWSKSEYLNELKQLINGIGKEHDIAQNSCKECGEKQAQIDRLMLEYCPEEMTAEQLEKWADKQFAYDKVQL